MARLLADENFPLMAVVNLRGLGHDVLTASEAGIANREVGDDDVLATALNAGRALLTLDRHDFMRRHRRGVPHAGIIVCTEDRDSSALAGRIDSAL